MNRYGFLFIGYKKKLYIWEGVIFLRKIFTVCVYITFVGDQQMEQKQMQIFLLICLCQISIFL